MPGRAALRLLGSAALLFASGYGWRLGWGEGTSTEIEAVDGLPVRPSAMMAHPQQDASNHPAVVAHWCGQLVAREVSCSKIGDICGAVCDQHQTQRERSGQEYPGKTHIDASEVLALAKPDGDVRRGRCAATLADRYGINLEILHGEDIFKSFRNGPTGPAQRDVQLDISGWGECACSEVFLQRRLHINVLGSLLAGGCRA